MRKTLTASFVDGVKFPAKGQATYWDQKLRGFGLRVSQGGAKSWVIVYRRDGRLRWHTIGTNPPLSLKDARDLAGRKLSDVQYKDADPAAEKKEALGADTFAALCDRYLRDWTGHKKESSKNEDERIIERDLKPVLGTLRANAITRSDVIALRDKVVNRGAKVHANRVIALVSHIFNCAIDDEVLEINPATRIKKAVREKDIERRRVLSDEELKAFWAAAEEEPPIVAALFKVLLLTGQRRNEVRVMKWSELDLDSGWWTIPADRTKNRKEHRVPIVGEALSILRGLHAAKGRSSYVFVGREGKEPFVGLGKSLRRILERLDKSLERENADPEELPAKIRIHDLRRTVGTGLGKLRVDRTVIGKVLNHSDPSVTAIYDRYAYDKEKRAALAKWDRCVREIREEKRSPAKVIPLSA